MGLVNLIFLLIWHLYTTFCMDNSNNTLIVDESSRPHYAMDPEKTYELALWEEHLATMLLPIYQNMSSLMEGSLCHMYIGKYLRNYHFDDCISSSGEERATQIMENPNLALRMIRRIVVLLQNSTKRACYQSFPDVEGSINEVFGKHLQPPTKKDLDDALLGLLRIHYIYGLNATSEIRLGIFNGVKTGAELNYEDCLALGNKAIKIKAAVLAYQWLVSAYLSKPDVGISQMESLNGRCSLPRLDNIQFLYENSQPVENTSDLFKRLSKTKSLQKLHEIYRGEQQMQMENKLFHNFSTYSSCRGEITMSIWNQSRLYCYYQKTSDPYFYINPIKTEVLSNDPPILQYYEFIGNHTIDFVLSEVSKNLERSAIISRRTTEKVFVDSRTSVNGWIYDTENFNPHKTLVNLNKRIEKLTGLEVYRRRASVFQVVSYGSLGGHYDFHHDSMNSHSKKMEMDGDRIATLLMILADVKMGGYTGFLNVGTFARPIKGSAILWHNVKRNCEKDPRLAHGGCPVILGNKKVANRWILQYENMWKRPCLTDPSL